MAEHSPLPTSSKSNCGCEPSQSVSDDVDEAALESFPASDPPAFTATAGSPSKKQAPSIVVPDPVELRSAPVRQPK